MDNALGYLVLPLTFFGISAIQAMSLQLILGGAGLLSLGHASFFAIGGYASAAFAVFGAPALGLSDDLTLGCGILCALASSALAGLLVVLPCLRLQGDYLAMATLGAGEIVSSILKNLDVVGGTRGFKDIPKLGGLLHVWVGAGLVWLFLHRFYQSRAGVQVLATRDDEIAAQSIGIRTKPAKVVAFVTGCAISGVAGAFYAHFVQFMSPDRADFSQSVEVVLAVVLGGVGSLSGSLLGAFILTSVPEALRFAPAAISQNRLLFFSSFVILLMLLHPQGLSSIVQRAASRSWRR